MDKGHQKSPHHQVIGQKPIGQAPAPRKVHVGTTVVGAIPGATTAPKPVVPFSQSLKRPAPTAPPAFKILPVGSKSEEKAPEEDIESSRETNKGTKTKMVVPAHTLRSAANVVWQDPTLADWDPNDFRIFVGDLGPEVSDMMLQQAFAKFGSLTKTRVIRDRKSGKSKGYGFVGFKEPQDFLVAIKEMNGKYIGSRPVKLKKSNWTDRCIDPSSAKKSKYRK